MRYEEISIVNSKGESFKIDLRFNNTKEFFDYNKFILICPGFMAFKDWGPFPYLGEQLCDNEFATIIMNYSHNGISENRYKITDFKKFFENTISKELDDISCVLNWLFRSRENNYRNIMVFIIGHSRGAANGILIAANYSINGLVTISPISNYDRWNHHQKSLWRNKGYIPLSNEDSNSALKIGVEYLIDLESNRDRYNLKTAVEKLRIPWLIIHGENDIVAKPVEAEKLYEWSDKSSTELHIIPGMGHMLGYNQSSNNEKNIFLNKIIIILKKWLNNKLRS